MFANIHDPVLVAGIALFVVIAYFSLVQYSKFVAHKKAHVNDEGDSLHLSSKFAFIPYFAIPFIFAVVSVMAGMCAVEFCVGKGYISTEEAVMFWTAAASVGIYILADFKLVGHIGDAVYFETIESKFHGVVSSAVDQDEITKAVEAFLKSRGE